MVFRVYKNMIKQGLQGMWRNRGMGLASVSSIGAVLIILGLVLIIVLSINNIAIETKAKFDEIQIFLKDDITAEDLSIIEEKIRTNPQISNFKFETREEALEKIKEDFGENADILNGLEKTTALPNSFVISITDIKYTDGIVNEFKDMPGVEKVPYYKDVVDKLINFSNYIRLGGLFITGILVLVSIFIISNTIKITVAARQKEIGIMKYVGATNGYIRGPFIIEGIVLGLIGSAISLLIINYGYSYFYNSVGDKLYLATTVYLVPPVALIKDFTIIFVSIGVGIGATGSIVALKRYLNV